MRQLAHRDGGARRAGVVEVLGVHLVVAGEVTHVDEIAGDLHEIGEIAADRAKDVGDVVMTARVCSRMSRCTLPSAATSTPAKESSARRLLVPDTQTRSPTTLTWGYAPRGVAFPGTTRDSPTGAAPPSRWASLASPDMRSFSYPGAMLGNCPSGAEPSPNGPSARGGPGGGPEWTRSRRRGRQSPRVRARRLTHSAECARTCTKSAERCSATAHSARGGQGSSARVRASRRMAETCEVGSRIS